MEFIGLIVTPALILGGWLTGTVLERRHLKHLLLLEAGSKELVALTIEDVPEDWHVESCNLVIGNVVISQDYFKRFAGAVKGIFGGNIWVYEPLLERARREALQRMKERARELGHDAVINVRLETAPMASMRGDGKGTGGVEILAFGTAVSLRERPQSLLTA